MTFFNAVAREQLSKDRFVERLDQNEILSFCRSLLESTELIQDCIIYNPNKSYSVDTVNIDFLKKTYGDLTGFEMYCNEIVVDGNFFESRTICFLIDTLRNLFETKFPNKRIVIILTNNDICQLRFHTYREEEGLWLDENIDNYKDEAVVYDL